MPASLDGRKALITGASSGIGEATALALVAEGAAVALARGARTASTSSPRGSRPTAARRVAIEADVADEAQAKSLVETRRTPSSAASTSWSTTPA